MKRQNIKLTALYINPHEVLRNMAYSGHDEIEVAKKEHAKLVYADARRAAEAVLFDPEALDDPPTEDQMQQAAYIYSILGSQTRPL